MVAQAEVMAAGENPRFGVTNLPAQGFRGEDRERFRAARRSEAFYGARGDRENGLKQQVLALPGERRSPHDLASNQLRLGLATRAYLLLARLRTLCLRGTEWAAAPGGTIRWARLKVAAQVTVSGRRV